MEEQPIIYQGTDFAVLFTALCDQGNEPFPLDDFDFIAVLSTSPTNRIVASTDSSHELTLERRTDNSLSVRVGRELTRRLSHGMLKLSVKAVHRPTNTASAASVVTIEVKPIETKDYEVSSNI